jgi:hypothetical protein
MFWVPCCREVCLWMGGVDASKTTAESLLQRGVSLQVYPGGSKEIFETRYVLQFPFEEFLEKRRFSHFL